MTSRTMMLATITLALVTAASDSSLAQGTIEWQETIGAAGSEVVLASEQTQDGGYVLAGRKTTASGGVDYWIAKLDANRNLQWQSTFGGSGTDYLWSMVETQDSGFLLGGWSLSPADGDKTEPSGPGGDYWVVKLDHNGNKQWDETIGGNAGDILFAVAQAPDGGYYLAGQSNSTISGDKTENSRGGDDYWIVKLRPDRTIEWQRTIGGTAGDTVSRGAVHVTTDGGLLVGGYSASGIGGDKTEPNQGGDDYWIVRLSPQGALMWQRTVGGSNNDILTDVVQARDGSYLVGGWSSSPVSGHKTQNAFQGSRDYWVVALESSGQIAWQQTLGGNSTDYLEAVTQSLDDGFLVGGWSSSGVSGNKTDSLNGVRDYWVVKLSASGAIQWQEDLGGAGSDYLYDLEQLPQGGYLLGGYSDSGVGFDKTAPSQALDGWLIHLTTPLVGVSAFHFEDPFDRPATSFPCEGWDIILDGSASQNEYNYYIDAWRRPLGSTGSFTWVSSLGWEQGLVGEVNLTDSFAANGFIFTPGYEYRIKLAVQNIPHFNWVETVNEFTVPAVLQPCGIPSEDPIREPLGPVGGSL